MSQQDVSLLLPYTQTFLQLKYSQSGPKNMFLWGIIFATGSQNKAGKTTNIDQSPAALQTAKESADECACFTHIQHDSGRQTISTQRTCGQKAGLPNKNVLIDHCAINKITK
jgi:hypothetical protein